MKWIRRILKGISLTAVLFVFQACYGTERDYYDTMIDFCIVSAETGEPIEGIQVIEQVLTSDSTLTYDNHIVDYTDNEGHLSCWTVGGLHRYMFVDTSSVYATADTVFDPFDVDTVNIVLQKA